MISSTRKAKKRKQEDSLPLSASRKLKSSTDYEGKRKKLKTNKSNHVESPGPSQAENNEQNFENTIPGEKSKSSKKFSGSNSTWKDDEYLAESEGLSVETARNIIKLFHDENTIPFIARYRNELTGGLKPDKLRKVKATFDYIQQVHQKKDQIVKLISEKEPLNADILLSIQTARSLEELEFISGPYKKDSKRTLAERAKQLGLETPARCILNGERVVDLEGLVDFGTEGLKDLVKVRSGIQHIIADIIRNNPEVHNLLDKMKESRELMLQSKLKAKGKEKTEKRSNYEVYGDFSQSVKTLKPHQVLAINRGEAENELSVKVVIPETMWNHLKFYCLKKYMSTGISYELRRKLISDSIEDAIKRLLSPFVIRRVRSKLTEEAENEAVNVFGANLRQLLLTSPFPGKIVMGIDPGFRNGCKVAVVSPVGDLIAHDKFFLGQPESAAEKLVSLISTHGCTTIALGNGVGCRETESLLSELIKTKAFKPLQVSYAIISEEGVSIYSCSPIAAEEFPNLQPTVVSAISIARRLQNPLSELVKVEPKHLGVGMYQHDVGVKKLVSALDDVVSECVSFVGVDVNCASIHLLKRIAGLSIAKAKEIIEYRTKNCPFRTREDLKKVKGIKAKTFQQCAGFIRIVPSTATCKCHSHSRNDFNILDQTPIHPESYNIATNVMKKLKLQLGDLGNQEFIESVKRQSEKWSTQEIAKYCECSAPSMTFILDTLTKPKDYDLRTQTGGAIFRQQVKKLEELSTGQSLTGVVRNVVPFGAFVDIGVGQNGLIHVSQMAGKVLKINDRVTVEVMDVNLNTQKVQLKLCGINSFEVR